MTSQAPPYICDDHAYRSDTKPCLACKALDDAYFGPKAKHEHRWSPNFSPGSGPDDWICRDCQVTGNAVHKPGCVVIHNPSMPCVPPVDPLACYTCGAPTAGWVDEDGTYRDMTYRAERPPVDPEWLRRIADMTIELWSVEDDDALRRGIRKINGLAASAINEHRLAASERPPVDEGLHCPACEGFRPPYMDEDDKCPGIASPAAPPEGLAAALDRHHDERAENGDSEHCYARCAPDIAGYARLSDTGESS